jgi:hypothetical protein
MRRHYHIARHYGNCRRTRNKGIWNLRPAGEVIQHAFFAELQGPRQVFALLPYLGDWAIFAA